MMSMPFVKILLVAINAHVKMDTLVNINFLERLNGKNGSKTEITGISPIKVEYFLSESKSSFIVERNSSRTNRT